MKSDFVAMVSHELRTPLTTVSGSVETLHLLDPTDREPYQEVLELLDQQTRRLRQKVEEDPSHPTLIQTVHGIGYRLVLAPASRDSASASEQE